MTGHFAVEIPLTGPWTDETAHSLPTGFPQLRKRPGDPLIHSLGNNDVPFLPPFRVMKWTQKQKLYLIESCDWETGRHLVSRNSSPPPGGNLLL